LGLDLGEGSGEFEVGVMVEATAKCDDNDALGEALIVDDDDDALEAKSW
jgi:hypothetical protein